MVHSYNNEIAAIREWATIEDRIVAGPGCIPATVYAKHHRALVAVFERRCVDIQNQAVFTLTPGLDSPLAGVRVIVIAAGQRLRRKMSPFGRFANAGP